MSLPLPVLVLVGLLLAVVGTGTLLARLGPRTHPLAWPLTEGMTTPGTRGRDLRLVHLERVLRIEDPHEAHRTLLELVERRLAAAGAPPLDDPGSSRLLGAELHGFLTRPPPATAHDYLPALAAALDRLERT